MFLDGGYLDHVMNQEGRPRIDYAAFSDAVCQGRERLRTYYYHCAPYQGPNPTDDERRRFGGYRKFTSVLQMLPRFTVREGRLQRIGSMFKQKGVDIQLAVDLVRLSLSGKIDHAVMVTGDSDFVPAIEAAQDAGISVVLFHHPRLSNHHTLQQAVDDRFHITADLLKQCLL